MTTNAKLLSEAKAAIQDLLANNPKLGDYAMGLPAVDTKGNEDLRTIFMLGLQVKLQSMAPEDKGPQGLLGSLGVEPAKAKAPKAKAPKAKAKAKATKAKATKEKTKTPAPAPGAVPLKPWSGTISVANSRLKYPMTFTKPDGKQVLAITYRGRRQIVRRVNKCEQTGEVTLDLQTPPYVGYWTHAMEGEGERGWSDMSVFDRRGPLPLDKGTVYFCEPGTDKGTIREVAA